MHLRPWHLIVCVLVLALGLVVGAFLAEGRASEVLLGLGLNLLSSVVFFMLLELYFERIKLVNGKEVAGFDYHTFARNVERSRQVRVLATFIYPLTQHPRHLPERAALLDAISRAVRRPDFAGIQLLFLHPDSAAARARAAERKDDDVLLRMREMLATVIELLAQFDGDPIRARLEVRLFVRPPAFALFQTDNLGSISFYYRDRPISEVARYTFFLDSPVGVFVERTFEDLWHDEQTIPLAQYLAAQTPNRLAANGVPTGS